MPLFETPAASLAHYNRIGLHYNLVADSVYKKLMELKNPFDPQFEPYLIAALLSFDMGAKMGASPFDRFASRLRRGLSEIKEILNPIIHASLKDVDLEEIGPAVISVYDVLARSGENRMAERDQKFHVGATKVLHFMNPALFLIVDSNVRTVLRQQFGIPYSSTTQPGYTSGRYLEALKRVKAAITVYGFDRLLALEPETPALRIFDKIAFVNGGGRPDQGN